MRFAFSVLALAGCLVSLAEERPLAVLSRETKSWPERFFHDVTVDADLSGGNALEFDFFCPKAGAFVEFMVYFRSGDGWYVGGFRPEQSGEWQRIRVPKAVAEKRIEGKPEGWSRITRIRFCGWRNYDGDETFEFENPRLVTVVEPTAEERAAQRERDLANVMSAPSRPGEFRAVWCHNAWGYKNGWDWERTVRNLKENGFTDVIANLCWGDMAAYPSKVLGAYPECARKGDAFAQAHAACAKYGIGLHVWRVSWLMSSSSTKDFRERMRAADRVQIGFNGHPVENGRWFCPTHPLNRQQEVDAMVELAGKGPDGIHFDFMRYPSHESCFCPRCRELFEKRLGRKLVRWPQDVRADPKIKAEWEKFRQETISSVVKAVAEAVRGRRLPVKISAAVVGNDFRAGGVAQDWMSWCREGWLDFVCPMDYSPSVATFEATVREQVGKTGNVRLYPGLGLACWPKADEVDDARRFTDQVGIVRKFRLPGYVNFDYDFRGEKVYPLIRRGVNREN